VGKVLPKCKCGSDVMYDYITEPMYDQDGSFICDRPTDVVFNDVCQDCYNLQPNDGRYEVIGPFDDEDELPF
jgi:hypothetical protein